MPPPDAAGADADAAGCEAGAGADAEAGADASGLGPAEPLPATLAAGVADGAGAYVQPGFAVVQAATTRMMATVAATAADRGVRMGSGTSSVGAFRAR